MRRFAAALAILAVAAAAVFYWLTAPNRLQPAQLANIESGNAEAGQRVFYAGGCESCHAAPGSKGEDRLKLAGGLALKTPFGIFHAPNISPDREYGIGTWSAADFANAMQAGVAPDGSHLYPAFPYTSYSRMTVADVADLWAFLKTLPAAANANRSHELPFPFSIRRGLGLWKLLYLSRAPVIAIDESNAKLALGRYLVEGPGHCGECHTPRDFLGGIDKAKWLGGGPAAEGKGRIPNITADKTGISDWTEADIAYALESGFKPNFDSLGSSMADVQKNTARLTKEDREAIAAYLKAVPAVVGMARKTN